MATEQEKQAYREAYRAAQASGGSTEQARAAGKQAAGKVSTPTSTGTYAASPNKTDAEVLAAKIAGRKATDAYNQQHKATSGRMTNSGTRRQYVDNLLTRQNELKQTISGSNFNEVQRLISGYKDIANKWSVASSKQRNLERQNPFEAIGFNAYLEEADEYQKQMDDFQKRLEKYGISVNGSSVDASKYNQIYFDSMKGDSVGASAEYIPANGLLRDSTTLDVDEYLGHVGAEEMQLYNYLAANKPEEAEAYRQHLDNLVQQRMGGERAEQILDKYTAGGRAVSRGAEAFKSGLAGAYNAVVATATGEDRKTSASEYAAEQLRADLLSKGDEWWRTAGFDAMQSIGNMAPGVVAGMINPTAGMAVFGATSGTMAYQDKLAEGWSAQDARNYGLLVGASEAALGKVIGGIPALGGAKGGLLNKLTSNVDNAIAKAILNGAGEMGSEALEEGLQTLIEPAIVSAIKGTPYDTPELKEVLYSAVLGAVTAAGFNAPNTAFEVADAASAYKGRYGADAQTLVNEAKQIKDVDRSLVSKAQSKLDKGKSISNNTAQQLTTTVNRSRMVDAVEAQINERASDMDAKVARSLANAVVAKSRNESLTNNQKKLIDKNKNLADQLAQEINPKAPADWAKRVGMRGEEARAYGDRNLVNAVEQYEQKTLTGGEYAEARADLIEQGQNRVEYTDDFDYVAEVYGNTRNFDNFDEVWDAVKDETVLTQAQARAAWEAGRSKLSLADNASKLTRRGTGAVSFEAVTDGDVQYEAPTADEIDSFKRGARYQYLETLAKKIGVDIVFFKGGAEGINGKYLDGTVYLAIDASPSVSESVNGYVMLTAAHELTHYIREASPARYAELKDFIIKHIIDKGKVESKTFKQLIEDKRRAYARANVELSVDNAIEEVVADACEMMLKDNTLVAQLRNENDTLYGSVSKWLKKFMRKVRTAFKGLEAHHTEARAIEDSFRELQRIWNLGITEAVGFETAARTETQTVSATDNAGDVQQRAEENIAGGRDSNSWEVYLEEHMLSLLDGLTTEEELRREWEAGQTIGRYAVKDEEKFTKDKYFDRQIDQWESKADGTRIKVGELHEGSALNRVGFPATGMWFDVGKIRKSFGKHEDHLTKAILKNIPDLLSNPIAITEYRGPDNDIDNTVNVFGLLMPNKNTPIVVGVMMTKGADGQTIINKVRTVHARGNATINDDNILYLNEDKKRTRNWFQVCGNSVPLDGSKFGFIRSISYVDKKSNSKLSLKDDAIAAWTQARDIMQRRNELQRNLEDFKTTEEYNTETDKFFQAVLSGENQEAAFAEYREWEERSGYAQMTAEIKQLDEEYNRLFDEYSRLNNEAEQEEKNAAIAKSGLDEDAYYQKQAVKEFGYTPFFYDAGYIVPNGKMLNFSGEKGKHYGMRGQDHRAIGTIYPSNISGSEAMLKFMGAGNVRIMAETPGIDIAVGVEPTKEQYSTIGKFVNDSISNRYFSVDFTDSKGITIANLEYEGNFSATKVKADIKHYFETGEIRKQSTVQRFMYSLKDEAYMTAVDSGDMETVQRMVDEAAERAGYDIKAYHGTPNGTFTVFRDWQYFTENRGYADVYQNQGASSNGYKATAQNPKTYSVFLKLNNIFDTRNPEEQRIFYDEFYRKWGNGAPLSERGLPDWTDGDDLIEFFEENGYSYDAVFLDEGGTGGYGDTVNDRGISIVVKESSQIKSADPVTYDDAGNVIPLSQRFNERQPDIRYSIKDEAMSDRMLLANTLMTAAQNDGERRRLNNYKAQIDLFDEIQEQLEAAEEELSRAYRAGDKKAIAKAQKERNALTEKLIKADSKLTELQATKPLKELLTRVRQDTRRNTQRSTRERRDKSELRKKIKTLHSQMSSQLLNPKENRYVPKSLLKTVAELLDLINLDSGRSEKIKAKLAELSGQYKKIANDNNYSYVFDSDVADMIATLQGVIAEKDDTSIYHMSKDELQMVYDTMKAINHTARTAVKLIGYEENRNIFELAKDMMRETNRANPVANKLANKYINATLRPDVFFKRMGGYVKNSVWELMGKMLNEAQRKQTQIQMEGAAIFEELMRDTKSFDRMTNHKELVDIGLEDDKGKPVLVTRDIAMKIYMDTMAEDNARHLMSGGYTVPAMREYYKGRASEAFARGGVTIHGFGPLLSDLQHQMHHAETETEQAEIQRKIDKAEADAANWVENLRRNIYDQLGDYELEWIRAAETFFNQYSQRVLNETTMAVYGFEKATVPYYVPIHTDPAYRQANFESISRDMSLENSGFMKARIEGAKNPMLAEGLVDVINGQIDKVAKYAAMMPAIRNFQKVYGKSSAGYESSVQSEVRSKFGNEALKYIENIITDLTSPRYTEGGLLGDFADRLRGNLAQAALTANPRVALEQATSYPKAAVIVGYGPLLKAMSDIRNNPVIDQTAREEIAKWTPLMWYRMQGYFDRDIGDLRKQDRLIKFLPKWIEFVEGSTVGQMWYAAQYYVEDTTNLERGTDEFMQETAKVFNRIVEQTQANYTMFQRPDILRNPNAIVKQLTMFMTERLQNANMVFDAVGTYNAYLKDFRNGENDVSEDDVKQAKQTVVRTASSLIAATASSVALKLLVDMLMYSMKGYRDEDEELTMASITGQVIENFFESAAGNFLWGSELFSIMRSVVTDETYYGISLGGVETFTDALNALVKTMQEPTWENWKKSIKNGMQMLGIPLNNGIKIYNAIAYRIKDVQEGNGWGSYASELKLTEEQIAKQLYNAAITDNEKRLNDLFEHYGTEAAADAALAKHIKSLYQNDELSAEEAIAQLKEYASMSEYDAGLAIDKLRFEKEHGFDYNDMKQQYIDGNITDSEAVKWRIEYGDQGQSAAEKEVNQWRMKKETDFEYDKIKDYLTSGDITKQQAIEYRMEYGGQDLEEATVYITKLMGEIETGIPYDKVEDYYRDGLVSHDELVDYYMQYWSYDELKAIQVADKRKFIGTDESLADASLAAVSGYYGYCDEADVDKRTYLTAYQTCYAIRADKDANGKSISGTALKKKLVYIDGLNLQPYQKTAVAKAIGITDKQLKKYKAAWL